jgi:hypothetical protein
MPTGDERLFGEVAHNGLAGRGHFEKFLLSFHTAAGGLCALW